MKAKSAIDYILSFLVLISVAHATPPSANRPSITISNNGSGAVGISVNATYNSGTRQVTDFHIERSFNNINWEVVSWSGNTHGYTDTTPGNRTVYYKCAVSDDNAANWYFSSVASAGYSVATPPSYMPPSANQPSITISNNGSGAVGVSVNATYNSGTRQVTDFHIERSFNSINWEVVSWSGNTHGYTDKTPGNRTVYYKCAVSDDNAANWYFSSVASASYSVATPPSYTPPSVNQPLITVNNNGMSGVQIHVTTNPNAGSRPVTDLHIERKYDNGAWEIVCYSGNSFSCGDITSGSHSMLFRAAVSDDGGQNWYFSSVASANYTVASNIALKFKILISINQLNGNEAGYASEFAADGVWSMPYNSIYPGQHSVSPLIPETQWPSIMLALNATQWVVSEDLYGDWAQTDATEEFIDDDVDAQMVYQEPATWDPPQSLPNDTTLLVSQINAAAAARGNPIVVHCRSYIQTAYYVQNALADFNCAGVVFEAPPNDIGGWEHKLNEGIIYSLAQGKRCYLLWPPRIGSTNYQADIQTAINFVAQSGQLTNPNLYIVLGVYDRALTGVSFINPNNLGDPNTVVAAVDWLRAYRGH